jgi:hypothetical protein
MVTYQIIIINKLDIAEELMDKRAGIYSGRSASTMIIEM